MFYVFIIIVALARILEKNTITDSLSLSLYAQYATIKHMFAAAQTPTKHGQSLFQIPTILKMCDREIPVFFLRTIVFVYIYTKL